MIAYKLTETATDKRGRSVDYVIGYYDELDKAKDEIAELLYKLNLQGYTIDKWNATKAYAFVERVEYRITRIVIR